MKRLRDRQKIRRRLYSRTTRVILLIIVVLLARSTWNIYKKNREAYKNLNRAEEELKNLEANHKMLAEKIEDLQTESGRDREIREKFGMAREGEAAVVIVKGKESRGTSTPEQGGSFWANVWRGVSSVFGE